MKGVVVNASEEHIDLLSVLRQVTIFVGLKEEGLVRIARDGSVASFSQGDILITEGTPATDILIVLEGKVKIVLDLAHEPLELFEFGPGNCLGETSVIGILDHSASVIAMEDTRVLVFSRSLLMDILHDDTEFFSLLILNIARELARRLHRTDEILLHYTGHRYGAPRGTSARPA
jgi:CRP/FNR family transcriptional regulator, cyclic AMP receptor protein